MDCVWQNAGEPVPVPLPPRPGSDPTLRDLLTLSRHYSDAELHQLGWLPRVLAARSEQVERVRQATDLLQPLGVDPAPLRELVRSAVHGPPAPSASEAAPRPLASGWKRPRQHTQRTLFTWPRERVLAEGCVTAEEAALWYGRGWLSFDVRSYPEVNAPERLELLFVARMMALCKSEHALDALLATLPPPFWYDPERVVYSLAYGWIELADGEEDR
jgi:hypothetical protein